MDYDRTDIAARYDRARALTPETRQLWLDLLSAAAGPGSVKLIIDLGCGTGRFSGLLAEHFGAEVIGVDPSHTMVDEARRKPTTARVTYRYGAAEALPLDDACADLVFISNAYHHFSDPAAAARECRRVLRGGGRLGLRNGTRENDFPQRHFFPALERLIETELPARAHIDSAFAGAGFARVRHETVTQIVAPDWASFVAKSALRADSFLARLSDEEFRQGMTALRAHRERITPGAAVLEEIDWFVFGKPLAAATGRQQ